MWLACRDIKLLNLDAKLVNESYPWIENQIVRMPKLSSFQEAVKDGLLDIGISPDNGFTYDHLYGTKVGGTIFDSYGRRRTAVELLRSANRKNLDVLIHATVQKIVFDKTGMNSTSESASISAMSCLISAFNNVLTDH